MYIGTAIGKTNAPYIRYSSTDKLLEELNFDTTGMSFVEDLSVFDTLKVDGIDGSGTVTLSYLKSHVSKKDSSYITSDDIGRSISVEFLGEEPMVAEIVDFVGSGGGFGALYNMSISEPPTVFPAYEYVNVDSEQLYIFFENKLEEDSFDVSVSFVDTGDVILNSTATFMQAVGIGYIYLVNLPAFDITSTLDPSDNETFNFSNITYWNENISSCVILGNPRITNENLPSNSDTLAVAIMMAGINAATGLFLGANPPYSEDFALSEGVLENGVNYWLSMISEETGLEEFDIYTALLSDITINEAYVVKGKLDGKYVDITPLQPAGNDSDELGGVYVPYPSQSGLSLDTSDGKLKIDPLWASSMLAGQGLIANNSKLNVINASSTTVGGIKIAVRDGACYITTNGQNP